MARFKVEDRVARREKPEDYGTVVKVLSEDSVLGAIYAVLWDDQSDSSIREPHLVPCNEQS